MMKVLFVAGNPKGLDAARLEGEAEAIRSDARMAEHRGGVEVVSRLALRPEDVMQAILDEEPKVLHVSGDGSELGWSYVEDGEAKPFKGRYVRTVFRERGYVHVVLMNACHTPLAAKVILETVVAVIATPARATDPRSIALAAAFYRGILAGKSVLEAYEDGAAAFVAEGGSDADKPTFQAKDGVNPRKFRFS